MTLEALVRRADLFVRERASREVSEAPREPAPGLSLLCRTAPTEFEASIYDPIMCLILRGRKETTVGERRFIVGAGDCIIVSHDLPVMARITEASPTAPYLALIVRLALSELRSVDEEVGSAMPGDESSAYAVGRIDEALLDVLTRYMALADDPVGAKVLTPLVRKELHFRLLMASHGAMLRRLLRRDSHANLIARAIGRLRTEYREPLEVSELARSVGMSTSSFYKHFKQVTETTPLQYQKDLRLTEARRLLKTGDHSVSTAAFEVGYESPTQFSREYTRKHGAPPSRDLRQATASA